MLYYIILYECKKIVEWYTEITRKYLKSSLFYNTIFLSLYHLWYGIVYAFLISMLLVSVRSMNINY